MSGFRWSDAEVWIEAVTKAVTSANNNGDPTSTGRIYQSELPI